MLQIKKNNLSYVLLFLLGLIWGSSFLFIKYTVLSLQPLTAVFLRMLVATACLFIYLKINKINLPKKTTDITNYFVIAILGNVLPFFLVSWAEITINTNVTGIIMGLMPIITVFLAYFFVKEEKINIYTFIGIFLGFFGLFFLLDIVANKNINLNSYYAVIIATLSFAIATIYARKIPKFNPLYILSGSTYFACFILIPLVFIFDDPFNASPTNQSIFFGIILGILNTAIGGLIFFKLIKLSGAAFTSTVNFITPFVAIVWGYFFLNETLNSNQILGFIFILLGIYLVKKSTNTQNI
ncbi:MAG: hypothetical protein CFH26_00112 [Alphaproteobacteria bacterium MarineAlpha6_Bin4]|nr:MAG: hypothetical protein CFH25_00576 [Alphaproteobacteria bacterium MarineAlpha6_Bin3]PPR38384.1 MAG: hypothetical protein CFH26_00112 [Alphaproteobacteria bacterium MarineAlpha6_Bin4]|tara:strand:- start:22200 stop:23090 length:891 start_codon:yes stop_codon:yes gene_type:complete